ncbi:hypothetical protein [Actinacidiphila oryziradicis]|uniref:Uncharacterized protein n=1 Tax=Actinacidiphila oryziradicis TaxID=2571141 RepID=A0A4U0SWR2_9ACTN|nr:hypothetical protein [Actinacidiphila oryziradicis]TKA13171.1 hypothetical protein FCI23_00035 [Actinacidiphila oryziradicis]
MSDLTPDVIALLAAVVEALGIPMADTTEDHHARAEILDARASDARIILAAAIRGDHVAVEQLRGWTADRPVTYAVWVPEQSEGGEPR